MADETQKKPNPVIEERKENAARITAALESEGYHTENAVISILKANLMTLVTSLPFVVLFVILFMVLCVDGSVLDRFLDIFELRNLWILPAMLLSVVIHEGLHGLGWVGFCKNKGKSIQFGMMWDMMTPYCHCREALSIGSYYVGMLLPFIVLGIGISVIGLVTGNSVILCLGLYNIVLAGGDLTVGCILVKYLGKEVKILDHPEQCGAVVFVK